MLVSRSRTADEGVPPPNLRVADMRNFCPNCGGQLQAEWQVCPACATPIERRAETAPVGTPAAPQRPSATPPPPGASLTDRMKHVWAEATGEEVCPGCHKTTGPPGALCPQCGSRYATPRVGLVGLGLGALGGLLLLIAYLTTGGLLETDRRESMSTVEAVGWLALVVGGGMFIYSIGRAGPERQSSCCGCSCALALIVLPTGALMLWSAGGPTLAALAIPAWIPLMWILDAGLVAGAVARGWARELTRPLLRMRPEEPG